MDSTRLRRVFRYADDDGADDEPEVLDEGEQDDLIRTLAASNHRTNEHFRRALLAVAALAAVPFLVAVVAGRASARPTTALLGLTSLGATAYLVWCQAPAETGIAWVDGWWGGTKALKTKNKGKGVTERSLSLPSPPSPLRTYLPVLNVGLCVVLLLTVLGPGPGTGTGTGTPPPPYSYAVLGSLPAIVYGLVLVAKVTMAGVDPERELDRLRYEYKGA